MDVTPFLQNHPTFTLVIIAGFGLVVGSFLNVVIARYPVMLQRDWRAHCLEYLKQAPEQQQPIFNLLRPRSHCPKCQQNIKAWQNVPVISYLLLGGECAFCKTKIPVMYPIVEILTTVLAVLVIQRFGLTWQALAAVIFTWVTIVLSFIDINEQILPDDLTLTLLWLGLFCNTFTLFTTPQLAIFGAIFGYFILWAVAKLFKLIRNKDGMGYGDFKMLAMIGAWLGATVLINVLLIAVIIGTIISLNLLAAKKITVQKPIPFGPFLAIGGWITMMYGPVLLRLITKWMS